MQKKPVCMFVAMISPRNLCQDESIVFNRHRLRVFRSQGSLVNGKVAKQTAVSAMEIQPTRVARQRVTLFESVEPNIWLCRRVSYVVQSAGFHRRAAATVDTYQIKGSARQQQPLVLDIRSGSVVDRYEKWTALYIYGCEIPRIRYTRVWPKS